MYLPGAWDSISHLIIEDDPNLPWVITCIVLMFFFFFMLTIWPCLPDIGPKKYCSDMSYLPSSSSEHVVVSQLRVFPIKSCKGHIVKEACMTREGLMFDRRWMVAHVDAFKEGKYTLYSQRHNAKMALISPSLPAKPDHPIVLSAPGMPSLAVPVLRSKNKAPVLLVRVWDDECEGVDQGDAAAQWLEKFLGCEAGKLRLLRMEEGFDRPTSRKYGTTGFSAFADGYPILIAGEESLDEFNVRLEKRGITAPISMDRFRPNIVTHGAGPFAEDSWCRIRIQDIGLTIVKPCSRCRIPTIDQDSAESNPKITSVLKEFRTGKLLGLEKAKWADEVFFGQNVIPKGIGKIRVGDTVTILRVKRKKKDT